MRWPARAADSSVAVVFACLVSIVIAIVFIFVWAPHPWGWEGFDHYDQLGLALARGESFPTTDVPWGYAYFLSVVYRLAGPRAWAPLVVQAVLNGTMPALVYAFARTEFDQRVAVAAALITSVFSFNTLYASTQSSDSVCSVLFLAAIVAFVRGRRLASWRWMAVSGALGGAAAQFRPNLLIVPLVLAGFHLLVPPRPPRRFRDGLVLLALSGLLLAPWVVRNYRLTHEIIPTSTHGGVQLWYGTLQTGSFLHSWSYNPRAAFESPTFGYTSLDRVPLIVSARPRWCAPGPPVSVVLVYWTDRRPQHNQLTMRPGATTPFAAEIPPSAAPTTMYYYFETTWPAPEPPTATPQGGSRAPLVFFVSTDHLGDMDRYGDLLDVFDLTRMLRFVAWEETLPFAERLDLDHDGRVTERDIHIAAGQLLSAGPQDPAADPIVAIYRQMDSLSVTFSDGSRLVVPRQWSGRITGLSASGTLAEKVLRETRPLSALTGPAAYDHATICRELEDITINRPFYRLEPQRMRRYTALALDNIRAAPLAYVESVLYRAFRLFVVEGSADRYTTQQFAGSGRIYRLAGLVSFGYFTLFLAGIWAAWRRGYRIALPLVLIAYVPLTIAYVLTNMRYSITIQPFIFMFVAVALLAAWDRVRGGSARVEAGARGRT